MRRCIFCSNPVNSAEDAWPRWLLKPLDSGPGSIVGEVDGRLISPERMRRIRVRCVCRECNNTWMSRWESEAIPVLEPLINSRLTIPLSIGQQRVLGRWAMKTAMVLEYTRPRKTFYTSAERSNLRATSKLPEATTIWIACYDGPRPVFSQGDHLETAPREDGASITGYVTNFSRGRFAFQILSIRTVPRHVARVELDVNPGRWRPATIQIWPHPRGRVWPPTLSLDSPLVRYYDFAERFHLRPRQKPFRT